MHTDRCANPRVLEVLKMGLMVFARSPTRADYFANFQKVEVIFGFCED